MFQYCDELDLIRGQLALIELAIHCQMYAESSSYELRPDYFHIITLIFARGEL
jgi:hypothetical protein